MAKRGTAFVLLIAVIAAVARDVLIAWWTVARNSDAASHVVLVPVMAAALVYSRRDVVFRRLSWRPLEGSAVLFAGASLLFLSNGSVAGGALSVPLVAVVTMCIGAFLLVFGTAAVRGARFPLLFLLLVIPPPAVIIEAATHGLKMASTEMVAILFSLTGTPFYREGFVFTLPAFTIQVADECSGIRSSLALVFTALMIGHLSLSRVWSRALLVLAVIPLTIFKNGLRIVTLSLLATHVDPSFLVGRLHKEGGILFFVLALGLLTPLLAILRRSDGERQLVAGPAASTRLLVD